MPTRPMTCPRCWGARCQNCAQKGVVPDVQLSPHFWLSELVASQTAVRRGIANEPSPAQEQHLRLLCTELLEPLRARFGPLHVDSGLRLPALNAALGGSETSVHANGDAADLVPLDRAVRLKDMADWLIKSSLSFDQVIFEGTWLHVGRLKPGVAPRRQALMMFPGPGGRPKYEPYDTNDARLCA